jgi:peptidoglycan L-alanyl-D-glutamate endopeptidase CwlK
MSTSLDALVPELQPFARELVNQAGIAGLLPRITSTYRNHFEQVRLYTRYLAGRALYPTALPGTSAHEYGEAFDLVVTPYEALQDLGDLWTSWGGAWGGGVDPVHFELPGASSSHRIGPSTHTVAEAADLVLGFVPGIGEVELLASLVHLGYPQSQVIEFLSGPLAYLTK